MHKLTHSPAIQGAVQFVFRTLLVFCFFLVPSMLVSAILSGLGAA